MTSNDVTVIPKWQKKSREQSKDSSKNVGAMSQAERDIYALEVSVQDSKNHLSVNNKRTTGTGWLNKIRRSK